MKIYPRTEYYESILFNGFTLIHWRKEALHINLSLTDDLRAHRTFMTRDFKFVWTSEINRWGEQNDLAYNPP